MCIMCRIAASAVKSAQIHTISLVFAVSSVGQHDIVEVLSSSEEGAASMDQDFSEQVCLALFESPLLLDTR